MKIKHNPIVAAIAVVLVLLGAVQFAGFVFFGDNNPKNLFGSVAFFAGTLVLGFGYLWAAKSFNPEL